MSAHTNLRRLICAIRLGPAKLAHEPACPSRGRVARRSWGEGRCTAAETEMRWTGARRAAPSSTHSRIVADEWITSHLLCSRCGSEYDQDRDECDCGCPDADLIEQGSVGRFWGYRGLRRELAVRQVTPRIGIAAGRLARRWHRAKLSSPTPPPPAAASAPSGSPGTAHRRDAPPAASSTPATPPPTMPDGVLYVPCGDRRASVCPPAPRPTAPTPTNSSEPASPAAKASPPPSPATRRCSPPSPPPPSGPSTPGP